MSIAKVSVIMNRIESADPRSPIVVFYTPKGLNAVFGDTVRTRLEMGSPMLIGSFNNHQKLNVVKNKLDSYEL